MSRQPVLPSGCKKRPFTSVLQAREAHRRAGYRIRVYRCPDCGLWHVTNDEKNGRQREDEA